MKRKILILLMFMVVGLTVAIACNWRLHTRTPSVVEKQMAPDFSLPSQQGRVVTLDDVTATGPAVVVFYRGYW